VTRSYRDRVYASYYTHTFASVNPHDDAAYRMHARILDQLLLPHLPASREADVIDIACGTGYAVHALRAAGYSRAHGIDLSDEQVQIAKSRGLPVERADLFDHLSQRRAAYDAIIALDVLEHLDREELLRLFDLARASLRPGGKLIAKTANANSLLAARFRYLDFTHEIIFTERSLRAALLAAGLEPVWIGGERYRPFTLGGWMRRAAAGLARAAWRTVLVAELGREGMDIPLEYCLIAVARRP
jgi:2-polyprenyl-3-methyl-5-hydroxy-6-metoxy-1,4-benzoquinol methylase